MSALALAAIYVALCFVVAYFDSRPSRYGFERPTHSEALGARLVGPAIPLVRIVRGAWLALYRATKGES